MAKMLVQVLKCEYSYMYKYIYLLNLTREFCATRIERFEHSARSIYAAVNHPQ